MRKQKTYYMDSLKDKSRMRIKLISDILDDELFKFACNELSPRKKETKNRRKRKEKRTNTSLNGPA
jgi:hypothetical protein